MTAGIIETSLKGHCSNFSPVPIRVMDGSEPGLDTPAAVLSGAPVELQARTVRYIRPPVICTEATANCSHSQHLQARQTRHAIRRLALAPLAHGLGSSI